MFAARYIDVSCGWRAMVKSDLPTTDLELIGRQVARHVDVALLHHQQLRGRIADMADHDPRHLAASRAECGLASRMMWSEAAQSTSRYGPEPALCVLHPGVAEIAVGLVRHRHRLLHDAAAGGGQAVQHEAARLHRRQHELQRVFAGGA